MKAREQAAAAVVGRDEVFETEDHINYTYEVDPDYLDIVKEMAKAIWVHDKGERGGPFPAHDEEIAAPYMCRADDALREAIPLLRQKIALELLNPDPANKVKKADEESTVLS